MSAYVDCPSCGMTKIPATVAKCGACEVDERAADRSAKLEQALKAGMAEHALSYPRCACLMCRLGREAGVIVGGEGFIFTPGASGPATPSPTSPAKRPTPRKRFRRRSQVIEAVLVTPLNLNAIEELVGGDLNADADGIVVATRAGALRARTDEWVIRRQDGTFSTLPDVAIREYWEEILE